MESTETIFQNIVEHSIDGIVVVDEQGLVLYSNPAAESFFRRKMLAGSSFGFPVVAGESAEIEIYNPAKPQKVLEMRSAPIIWDEKGAYVISLRDITKRKEMETALQESKEEWEKTFNSMSDIVTLQDTDMRIVKINMEGCRTLGRNCEELRGSYCYEMFRGSKRPCAECPLLDARKDFLPYSREVYHERLGKIFLVSAAPVFGNQGNLIYIAHIAKDITEKKKIESELLVNEKMRTVAGLAAGVAHEINTPLSAIIQSTQIIQMAFDPAAHVNKQLAAECGVNLQQFEEYCVKNDIPYFLEGIRSSAANAGHIVKNLLEFSRPATGHESLVDLPKLIGETIELVCSDYELKKKYKIMDICFTMEHDPSLPSVSCVAMDIQQVLINLIKNAVLALRSEHSGDSKQPVVKAATITIKTFVRDHKVCMEISDNGPGMEKDVLDRIFEPFFTTMEVGEGKGLGLSTCHTIICDRYGGSLQVESAPEQGATFTIVLPVKT